MSLKQLVTSNVDFNEWANQLYLEWLSTKSDEALFQEIPSSCSSIIKTLKHIWEAQEFWYGIIAETDDFVKVRETDDLNKDRIFEGLRKNSKNLTEYVRKLSEIDLSKTVKIENAWLQCDFPKYEYIQHLVIHTTYHRGQIVTIGHNVGITDAPMADFNFWNIVKHKM